MLATHLDSTFFCTREALKVMIPKQSGRIINMGSIAGTTGLAFASEYCAAKGGIISFTKSVAREVVPMGILVNCIAPGFIDTPMTPDHRRRDPQADRSDDADRPLRRAERHRGGGAFPGLRRLEVHGRPGDQP